MCQSHLENQVVLKYADDTVIVSLLLDLLLMTLLSGVKSLTLIQMY